MSLTQSPFAARQEGLFGIPAELYHDHAKAPDISRSLVVEMATMTPAHVKATIDGKRKKEVTDAMKVGLMMDAALLEPDKFVEGVSHYIRPEGMKFTTKEGIAWKKDHPLEIPVIDAKNNSSDKASVEDIKGMIASVMAHPKARHIVEQSTKQESAFCHCPDSGLLRKCRPDTRLADNYGKLVLADLKTTFVGGTAAEVFAKHAARMGYYIQDPFYSDIYKDLLGEAPFFIFFVVERKPPYSVRVFQIAKEGKAAGREQAKRALEQFATCKASGVWPAYSQEIETVQLPRWALAQSE